MVDRQEVGLMTYWRQRTVHWDSCCGSQKTAKHGERYGPFSIQPSALMKDQEEEMFTFGKLLVHIGQYNETNAFWTRFLFVARNERSERVQYTTVNTIKTICNAHKVEIESKVRAVAGLAEVWALVNYRDVICTYPTTANSSRT